LTKSEPFGEATRNAAW